MTPDELLAREAIRHCLLRHFRAVDRGDEALERTAFWPDGQYLGGPVAGPASDFVGPLFGLLGSCFERVMHSVTNMLITVSGDSALVEAYATGWQLLADTPEVLEGVLGPAMLADLAPGARYELLIGARYAVEMARREGEWRILTMQPIIEWTRVQQQAGITEGGLPAAMPTVPLRHAGDASYFAGRFQP
ncbi:nuclear transport factor 2 family protein [Novosphingobium rosa]|uniref:nuclear transport factor 2 family protein n=1 Tax=Novosphingobium rosa TaxID=76978 RepID=UPI00083211FB|nr:nuclear transport factor 2 family protein [Novosphingobium rosa]